MCPWAKGSQTLWCIRITREKQRKCKVIICRVTILEQQIQSGPQNLNVEQGGFSALVALDSQSCSLFPELGGVTECKS